MNASRQELRIQTVCLLILSAIGIAFALYFLRPVLIPLVLAMFLAIGLTPVVDVQVRRLRVPHSVAVASTLVLGVAILARASGGPGRGRDAPPAPGPLRPVPPVAGDVPVRRRTRFLAAAWLANVQPPVGDDTEIRRTALYSRFDDRAGPSMGLAAWLAGEGRVACRHERGWFTYGPHAVPVDGEGQVILRYAGASRVYTPYRAAAVLQSHIRTLEGREPVLETGVFERAITAIRHVRDKGFRVNVNTTLFDGVPAADVAEFFDFVSDLGIEGITVSPGYSYERAPDQAHFLRRRKSKELFRDQGFPPFPEHLLLRYSRRGTSLSIRNLLPWHSPGRPGSPLPNYHSNRSAFHYGGI